MASSHPFTLGVEEEYQIVNPATRQLQPGARRILSEVQREVGEAAQNELFLSQIEVGTPICHTLADVRDHIVRLRRAVIAGAERGGNRIAAAGTHPFSHWEDQPVTPKARYQGIEQEFQQLAREQIICGCHVHLRITRRLLPLYSAD